ncbi:MAG TPA: methyltransferase domain-containing protein [Anaerolineales bacterium]|nr:methyltransferase domain-containing protein [Anaerolineales bacterium]
MSANRRPQTSDDKAAVRGLPSYVWREGQERRLQMMVEAAGPRLEGRILVDGCGIGLYLERLAGLGGAAFGLDIEFDRVSEARRRGLAAVCAAGEALPFPDSCLDFLLSHEVLEHVADDRLAVEEMVRVLRPGGRIALFAPNRGYPFETHGIYWRGTYRFGNIPLVNYLPSSLRDRLAPHVRAYRHRDLAALFDGLPVKELLQTVIFGGYDNLIARWGRLGSGLRSAMQALERTPLNRLGLSHFWVVEKIDLGL